MRASKRLVLQKFVKRAEVQQQQNFLRISFGVLAFGLATVAYRQTYMKNHRQFFMHKKVVGSCDWWCVGHMAHYALIGFFAPKYSALALALGVLFEIVETKLDKTTGGVIKGHIVRDSLYNATGILIGNYALTLVKNQKAI